MKTYKQYFKEQGSFHHPSRKFRERKYNKDAESLVKRVDVILKRLDGKSPEEIRQDIEGLLFKIEHLYLAGEGERTPSLGKLAKKWTQVKKRQKSACS